MTDIKLPLKRVCTDTSERDFRRALVVALAGGVSANSAGDGHTSPTWVCDCADEIATEYLLRELRRERGGK